jgi:hypothetical protein
VRWIQLFQLLDGLHENEGPQASLFRSSDSPYGRLFAKEGSQFYHLWTALSSLFTRWQRWRTEIFFNGKYSFPIGIASFFDFIEVVKSEGIKGKDTDSADAIGFTSAMLAAHGESPQVLQYTIDNGANIKLASVFGYGVARYAARNSPCILPYVLEAGASASIPTLDDGGTPIHAASTSPGFHPSILPQLLQNALSTDLDAKDFSGRTALHYAAGINIKSFTRLVFDRTLIFAGASPQHRRLHTGSPEEAFMPSNRAEVETWLKSWNEYFAAIYDRDCQDVVALVDSGVLTQDDDYCPPSGSTKKPPNFDGDSTISLDSSSGTIDSEDDSIAIIGSDSERSDFDEDEISDLVRKIKATMIIWLAKGGASPLEKDD